MRAAISKLKIIVMERRHKFSFRWVCFLLVLLAFAYIGNFARFDSMRQPKHDIEPRAFSDGIEDGSAEKELTKVLRAFVACAFATHPYQEVRMNQVDIDHDIEAYIDEFYRINPRLKRPTMEENQRLIDNCRRRRAKLENALCATDVSED